MRRGLWLAGAAVALLSACVRNEPPKGEARLILHNSAWALVHVQVVVTRSADCNSRGPGFISAKTVAMQQDGDLRVDAPDGAGICWRHDRNPNHPIPGDWTGWSRATLYPGTSTTTGL